MSSASNTISKQYNTRSKTKVSTETSQLDEKNTKEQKDKKKENVLVISLDNIFSKILSKKNDDKNDNNDDENECSDDDSDYEEEDEDDEIIQKINALDIPEKTKEELKEKYLNSDDYEKCMTWINTILKIPFGKYSEMPVSIKNTSEEIVSYFENAQEKLNSVVYGMDNVKEELMSYIAQIITSGQNSNPRVLALHSVAGAGKTTIIRKGFAPVLNRPIQHVSLGGMTDSSTFFGFDYTYYGSKCGAIVQAVIDSGVMNPIIFLDELDKISETTQGLDIVNFLIHLTDPEQQSTFKDKYIGFDIDLSKVMFVFAFNDDKLIHPVLIDRLNVIKIKPPSAEEKKVIALKYIMPEACKNIGFSQEEVEIDSTALGYIIRNFDKGGESGMRNIKRAIETIIMRLNTLKLVGGKIKLSYTINPVEIETDEYITVPVSKRKKLKMRKPVMRKIYKITETNIRKIMDKKDEDVSYQMMFL